MANKRTPSLLEGAFGDSIKASRSHLNSLASRTMARFTVLLFALLVLAVMLCFFN